MSTPAKNLTQEAPRSPRNRLGGYALLARATDKGRASIAGTAGEYHFACPLDQQLFEFKGVQADEVKKLLASGATDDQVVNWFNTNGTPKTADEITAWVHRRGRLASLRHAREEGLVCRRMRQGRHQARDLDA